MEEESAPEDRKKLLRSWWWYTIKCVLTRLKRPDRKFMVKWSKDVIAYKKVYEQILINRFNQTVFPLNTTATVTTTAAGDPSKVEHSVKLRADLAEEQKRIEAEWNFERLVLTRRVIFEKFVKNPIFKEYFVKLKQNNSLSANQQANDSASSYRVYNYVSWSINRYYYGKFKLTLNCLRNR